MSEQLTPQIAHQHLVNSLVEGILGYYPRRFYGVTKHGHIGISKEMRTRWQLTQSNNELDIITFTTATQPDGIFIEPHAVEPRKTFCDVAERRMAILGTATKKIIKNSVAIPVEVLPRWGLADHTKHNIQLEAADLGSAILLAPPGGLVKVTNDLYGCHLRNALPR